MKINYNECPVCNAEQFKTYLTTADFCVTNENFELKKCNQCRVLVTEGAPDINAIAPYYQFDDYISHTDTKASFFYKLYHEVREYTIKKKLKLIHKYTKNEGNVLLDIGSGTGVFVSYAISKKWDAMGIEANEKSRDIAVKNHFVRTYGVSELHVIQDESQNAVTMWHVLEHIHQLEFYLQTVRRVLKKTGVFVLAVPNYKSFDALYYKKYWAAYDTPRHLYHFSPKTMAVLAEKYGFTIIEKKRMFFDSYYVSILSAGYGNKSKFVAVLIAFLSNFISLFNINKCSSLTYVLQKKESK